MPALFDHLDWRGAAEQLAAVLFDDELRPFRTVMVADGGSTAVALSARRLLSLALAAEAYGVALAHNHPSGDATPSLADRRLTGELKRLLRAVEIVLVDHLILADGRWSSMRALGLL